MLRSYKDQCERHRGDRGDEKQNEIWRHDYLYAGGDNIRIELPSL